MQKEYLGGIATFMIGVAVILLLPHWRSFGAGLAISGLVVVALVIWRGRTRE